MSWSYRICKSKTEAGNIKYDIREVYDNPIGVTSDAIAAECFLEKDGEENTEQACVESIRKQLVMMLLDTTRPVFKIK